MRTYEEIESVYFERSVQERIVDETSIVARPEVLMRKHARNKLH